MGKAIGIIGCGNMGSAIATCLKSRYKIWAFDKDKNKTKNISGIQTAKDNADLVNKADIIILAVKPQDFDGVLDEIKPCIEDKLIISIAAGITTGYIERYLGAARVIRAMPNLPAKVAAGMICLYKGKSANNEDLIFSEELFGNLGWTLVLSDEDMINAATAVSGSGPGFLYDAVENKSIEEAKEFAKYIFIPSLAASAEKVGFTKEQAMKLAKVTTDGSISFLEQTNISPAEAKKMVASKKGTTEAGLEVLHKGGTLEQAVEAAKKRAEELSKRE